MADGVSPARWISDVIPGFQGYVRQDCRLADDRLLRGHIAMELKTQRDRLAEVAVDLLARNDPRFAEIDRAVMALQSLIDAVRSFAPDDGSWASRARLREEDVDLLRLVDTFLLRGVERVTEKVGAIIAVRSANQGFGTLAEELLATVSQMGDRLERRTEVILSPLS